MEHTKITTYIYFPNLQRNNILIDDADFFLDPGLKRRATDQRSYVRIGGGRGLLQYVRRSVKSPYIKGLERRKDMRFFVDGIVSHVLLRILLLSSIEGWQLLLGVEKTLS